MQLFIAVKLFVSIVVSIENLKGFYESHLKFFQ